MPSPPQLPGPLPGQDPGPIPGPVQVRPARTAADVEAAGQIVVAAFRHDDLADERYYRLLAQAQDRADRAVLLVAADRTGQVVGTVTYAIAGNPYAQVARPGQAEFRMLGVAAPGRGQGVGEALVQACIERARADGAEALVLCTATGMVAAQRLYQRLGFVRAPELDWSPTEDIDLVGYRLALGREG